MGEAEKTKSEPTQTMKLAVMALQSLAPLPACSRAADSESMRNRVQDSPMVSSADLTLKDPYGRESWRAFVWVRGRYRCSSCQCNLERKDREAAIFQGVRQVTVKCRSERRTVEV